MDKMFRRFGRPHNGAGNGQAQSMLDNVPIVGLPLDVYHCTPVAVGRCRCRPENQPFTLAGIEQGRVCDHCGNVYVIGKVSFDRQAGQKTVSVSIALVGTKQQLEASKAQQPASPVKE